MPMVDVEEPGDLAGAQLGLGAEVALVPGLRAETLKGEGDRSAVGRLELSDRDVTPHR
jgi:hypothetical protein